MQAIATAARLGGIVLAYDVRPGIKEQVQSLGAKFVEMPLDLPPPANRAAMPGKWTTTLPQAAGIDGPGGGPERRGDYHGGGAGQKAPVLVTSAMVEGMAAGSVLVDLAAERGGNCELTRRGQTVVHQGVTILGPLNLPSEVPNHASQLYAKNIRPSCWP